MRGCILILLLAVGFAQEQQPPTRAHPVGGISIPAELTTTVRAEKVHRGDQVAFRTLQAVLMTDGLVMPAHAKLTGRIVGAEPLQGDKPSWLVLLVERADWKDRTIPLHAFIAAQLSISREPAQPNQPLEDNPSNLNPRRASRESGRVAIENGVDISSTTRLPQDSRSAGSPADLGQKASRLKDLRIVRDKDGIAYLFSSYSNVNLPSGTLFVLQDVPAPAPAVPGPSANSSAPVATPQR